MLDPETFLVELYVLVDEFCKTGLPVERRPGPAAALARGEVITLAVFGQWAQFPSETAFYRWAAKHLRGLFPTLPSRPQLNRLLRRHREAITAFALHLGQDLAITDRAYEAIDGTWVRTRNAKRRGAGWLAGLADIGKCTRLGWYEGVRLLLAVTPRGGYHRLGERSRQHQRPGARRDLLRRPRGTRRAAVRCRAAGQRLLRRRHGLQRGAVPAAVGARLRGGRGQRTADRQ